MSGRDYHFKNLASWQKAQALLTRVLAITRAMPRDREADVFARQMIRSCSAIGANIAEGHGRYSAGAYRNHLSIARGSTTETISWLDGMRRAGYITQETETSLTEMCEELMRLLSAKMIELDRATHTDRSFGEERAEYRVD